MKEFDGKTKVCSSCKQRKNVSSFFKRKASNDGMTTACIDCLKMRYIKRKQRTTPSLKRCVKCNIEKPAAEFDPNPSFCDLLRSKCISCFWTVERRIKRMISGAKSNASRRSKSDSHRGTFDLTEADLMNMYNEQHGMCYISGMKLLPIPLHLQTMSIERKDESKGYLKSNVVLVCSMFNSFCQMTREKFFYITQHHDDPISEEELDDVAKKMDVFHMLAYISRRTDATNGVVNTSLTADQLFNKFREQKGCCAYSDVRMYVGANVPTFQMSIERVDRSKYHSIDNVVLIIRELNIGGHINLSREIVQTWKQQSQFKDRVDLCQLRRKYDEDSIHVPENQTCTKCGIQKDITAFYQQGGSFLSFCKKCKYAQSKLNRRWCFGCKRRRPICFFEAENTVCTNCPGKVHDDPHAKRLRVS